VLRLIPPGDERIFGLPNLSMMTTSEKVAMIGTPQTGMTADGGMEKSPEVRIVVPMV
jgi:hypothetical protein